MNASSRLLSVVPLLLSAIPHVVTAQTLVPMSNNGDSANRIDILFVGDGYTSAEQSKFALDAANLMNQMFAQEPFKEYIRYFNIRRLEVNSTESGADHSNRTPPVFRNTAFDAAYNCSGIQRLICVSLAKLNTAIAFIPSTQRDLVLVIVNDPEYGGSGGSVSVASTNTDSTEIILHEIGHSLGLLADEYGGPPPPNCASAIEPVEANATKQSVRSLIKWNAWIDVSTPIPTATTTPATPGLYAGAKYCDTELFRPTYNSKMRSVGLPFEQINTEQLVKRFYSFVSPVDTFTPAGNTLTLNSGQNQVFAMTLQSPLTHNLNATWRLGGTIVGAGATFNFNAASVSAGTHTLTGEAVDPTILVRTDAAQLLVEQNSWTITVNGAAGAPGTPASPQPIDNATNVTSPISLAWSASGATTYDIYFGTVPTPPFATSTTQAAFNPGPLSANTIYYWRVVARNTTGSTSGPTWKFTVAAQLAGMRFIPVTPCRVADSRGPTGSFGGPVLPAGSTRNLTIPSSTCGIPQSAAAYSLNVTVVPREPLAFLTLWPTGQPQPLVSTLNSFHGGVVANAAIVPAGANGAVTVYVTNLTDVILDINGYFDSVTPTGSSFYTVDPCRLSDTRPGSGFTGAFGPPTPAANATRSFPIPGNCGVPLAAAYALNVTVVPPGPLAYLTIWPTGQSQPVVSTLNSFDGAVVANAAVVPAGAAGAVSTFVTNAVDTILDINGYFAAPGSANELRFQPISPCRVADTRNTLVMNAGTTRTFPVAGSCNVPSEAKAYSLNVTVVPVAGLPYLTVWPTGKPQPFVSTLNSFLGRVVANAAVVPAGTGGAVNVFVAGQTHVIVDINGYFK